MTNITPTYYAANAELIDCVLEGENLDLIPADAVGILATGNASPTAQSHVEYPDWIYDIVSRTETRIVLRVRSAVVHGFNTYVGCLVSPDRETIYWTNETRPLP